MATSALLKVLLDKLGMEVIKQLKQAWNLEKDLDNLESTLSTIQAVVMDAEEKSIRDEPLRNWLRKLKEAAYDAEDLLDEFQLEAERLELEIRHRMVRKVRYFFSHLNPLVFRLRMARKMKQMRERLDAISDEKNKFHLSIRDVDDGVGQVWRRETLSMSSEKEVYGRDDDKEKIMKLLLDDEDGEDVSLISIVGMGGLGKTTLAGLVYNDERTMKHFHLQIWLCVSQVFDLERLVKAAIENTTKEAYNLKTMEAAMRRLEELLKGKRTLVVLDDVWTENDDELDWLNLLLRASQRGSKAMMTTRKQVTASKLRSKAIHHLEGLAENDCWALFKSRAFGREEEENPWFINTGREIVGKCGGVPVVAKALGSMLYQKKEHKWEEVRDSELWQLSHDADRILASLRLSYNNLSPGLKRCFAYCAIFPKGHEIYKDDLIAQWAALGFISNPKGSSNADDNGSEYFHSLLWMSLLQYSRYSWFKRTSVYKMHDLVHDLARSVAGEEIFHIASEEMALSLPKGCRYLLVMDSSVLPKIPMSSFKKMRAIVFIDEGITEVELARRLFSKARCLRIMEQSYKGSRLPASIRELKNLRYLCFPETEIQTLPESFGSLHNLRTLYLPRCDNLQNLPESINGLRKLRALDLHGCGLLGQLPTSFCSLHKLVTLDLSYCSNLQSLSAESVAGLESLASFNLKGCSGLAALPDSIGTLEKLESMDASYCCNLRSLPQTIGKLTRLQRLNIKACELIQELPEDLSSLRNLRHLHTRNCTSLKGMPLGMGQLTNLKTLSMFVVGKNEDVQQASSTCRRYSGIAELKHLNLIEGKLEIVNLENVMSPMEAMLANLKEKQKLRSLRLSWSDSAMVLFREEGEEEQSSEQAVLENLAPHANIERLKIHGYPGNELPDWLMRMRPSDFPSLVGIDLIGLKRSNRLPPLGNLLSLQSLRIEGMDKIRCLDGDLHGSLRLTSFMSLEELVLGSMPNLEEWWTRFDQSQVFPCLGRLEIDSCPKLIAQPCLPASVVELRLWDSHELLLSEESLSSSSSSLKRLHISSCKTSFGWKGLQGLTALEILKVEACSCLPESIRGLFFSGCTVSLVGCELPEWMEGLNTDDCNDLSAQSEAGRIDGFFTYTFDGSMH